MVELAAMKIDPQGRPVLTGADMAALSRLLDEPGFLTGRRLAALERYAAAELPDRVRHLWRFSDPKMLMPETAVTPAAQDVLPEIDPAGGAAALLRGGTRPRAALPGALRSAGIELVPLSAATGPELDLFDAAFAGDAGFFAAFNAAAWNSGLLLRVPEGVEAAEPIHVRIEAGGGTLVPRLLVLAGPNSAATLIEEHVGGDPGGRVIGGAAILAGPGSRVRHGLMQLWNPGVSGHLTRRARLERDAELLSIFATTGGDRAKLELTAELAGRGARSEMIGVSLGVDGQRHDHHTAHRHLAGGTWSNIDFRAVAAAGARSSYTGLIRIDERAAGSEAFQENRNLLLDESARADSIPELEILTDDVGCSHGATVAPIDREQIFYLRSRGLTEAAAERLVVEGFLRDTIDRLPDGLRDGLAAVVQERLDGLSGGER